MALIPWIFWFLLFKWEIVLELTEIFKRKGDRKNEKKYK